MSVDPTDLWLDAMESGKRCETCSLHFVRLNGHNHCRAWDPMHCPAVREATNADLQGNGDVPH